MRRLALKQLSGKEHLSRARAEGLKIGDYARKYGVSAGKIYKAKQYLEASAKEPQLSSGELVRVELAAPPETHEIEITLKSDHPGIWHISATVHGNAKLTNLVSALTGNGGWV
jgi:hypothetical protein